ncbi:MAG: hypothetical protein IGR92_00690 [Leptolyngbyaceae cyanobacterium T60_A2020_046]|nr:hypothetical protein [Leptolyngbyaceae cyanobacterium T60_A2020_046]
MPESQLIKYPDGGNNKIYYLLFEENPKKYCHLPDKCKRLIRYGRDRAYDTCGAVRLKVQAVRALFYPWGARARHTLEVRAAGLQDCAALLHLGMNAPEPLTRALSQGVEADVF